MEALVGETGDGGVCKVVRVVGVDQVGEFSAKMLSKWECVATVWIGE